MAPHDITLTVQVKSVLVEDPARNLSTLTVAPETDERGMSEQRLQEFIDDARKEGSE